MKPMLEVCLIAVSMTCAAGAQNAIKPALQPGIHVEMPVAAHAVKMPAADREDAMVVTVTADGNIFIGADAVEMSALSSMHSGIVYVKADARVPYQAMLTLLDALRGRSVVLLTEPSRAAKSEKVAPYGVKLLLAGE